MGAKCTTLDLAFSILLYNLNKMLEDITKLLLIKQIIAIAIKKFKKIYKRQSKH